MILGAGRLRLCRRADDKKSSSRDPPLLLLPLPPSKGRRIWNLFAYVLFSHATLTSLFGQLIQVRTSSGKVFATQMSPNVYDTQYGKIRGLIVTLPSQNFPQVEVFLGLQYASLLGGDLRFMPPTSSIEKWEATRVAIKFRPVCPQKLSGLEREFARMPLGRAEHLKRILHFLEKQSEDCLNLNLYVPVRGKEGEIIPCADFNRKCCPLFFVKHNYAFVINCSLVSISIHIPLSQLIE